jgi:hypothetical protein
MVPSIGLLIAACLIGGVLYSLVPANRGSKASPRAARRESLRAAMFRSGFGPHRLRW